ncbi:MAG: hypothetical protein LBT94_06640 [Prevotellaceae bacterium]|jgi:hypothetical protein|nr:hypothetical protein [Prevotellaceae bacterium]
MLLLFTSIAPLHKQKTPQRYGKVFNKQNILEDFFVILSSKYQLFQQYLLQFIEFQYDKNVEKLQHNLVFFATGFRAALAAARFYIKSNYKVVVATMNAVGV